MIVAPGYVSYDSYRIDTEGGVLEYHYGYCDEQRFVLCVCLDLASARDPAVARAIEATVFALGQALLSYVYVAFCTPEIRVRAAWMDAEQQEFWHALFEGGLMEHFYVHLLSYDGVRWVVGSGTVRDGPWVLLVPKSCESFQKS